MSFNTTSYQDPFWAKSGNFVRGRDPLGIQNSSISVYATLLPGMTNLTLRIRYYGFYLWLLDEYLKLEENNVFKKDVDAHYTFIRRGELILAFVMGNLHPNEFSVIGSDYVSNHLTQLEELGYYDIEHGADKKYQTEENKVYWDYRSGALGQYYAGSLIGLDLMEQRQGYFRRTDERGLKLAEAFKNSVEEEQRSLILKRINDGKLYEDDINNLDQFALNAPIHNLQEGEFYFNMLVEADSAKVITYEGEFSFQRKQSIRLFLEKIEQAENISDWYKIPQSIYQENLNRSKKDVSDAAFGWYFYQLNEFVHYYLEAIFWGLLSEMDGREYAMVHFLEEMTQSIYEECEKQENLNQIESVEHWLSENNLDTSENINALGSLVKGNATIEGMALSIKGLMRLYTDNVSKMEELKHHAYNHKLHDKRGNAIEIFERYIIQNKVLSVKEFIHKILHSILNEHMAIAYYKMGNGDKNLLKFLIEDNYLVHIETMGPNFTNPRLRTLFNFMVDLRVLDADGNRLERGDQLLEELQLEAQ